MTDESRSYGYVRETGIDQQTSGVKLKDKQMKTVSGAIIMRQQSASGGVKQQTPAAA